MRNLKITLLLVSVAFFASCNKGEIEQLQSKLAAKDAEIEKLEEQVAFAQATTKSHLDLMEDLSIVNKEGAESIRQSLENINQQYAFIEDLTERMQAKDSLNLALVMNLKRSLADINDEDVQVEVKGGIVYVSISDKLLFASGSSRINSEAQEVLGKIATVLNDHADLNVLVEGHTDNVPMGEGRGIIDNWDLSAKRATSVVRVLQNEHFVAPERLTAAGRSEYMPKAENETEEGKAMNRRTEILIMPRFDQFFKLLEGPEVLD